MKDLHPSENKPEKLVTYETSEEVLLGIIKAFSDFQRAVEQNRK